MTWLSQLVEASVADIDDRVREALWTRGVSDEQIRDFRVGYVDKLPDVEYPAEFLKWCWDGKRVRDCYVFPLTNAVGEIKGVQFRAVDRDKKGVYLDYFLDIDEPVLFGTHQAMPIVWETDTIWLVEGVFDLFPIQRVYPNVVATMTARVTDQAVRFLKRLVKTVYVAYDNDETGRKSSRYFQRFHGEDFQIHDVHFPKVLMPNGKVTKDPGDLWEVWGDDRLAAFLRCIENPVASGV